MTTLTPPLITRTMLGSWNLGSHEFVELCAGREALTPHAICDSGLPASVRLYALLRPEVIPALDLTELVRLFAVRALRHHYIEQLADIVGLLGGYCASQRRIAALDAQLAAGELTTRVHALRHAEEYAVAHVQRARLYDARFVAMDLAAGLPVPTTAYYTCCAVQHAATLDTAAPLPHPALRTAMTAARAHRQPSSDVVDEAAYQTELAAQLGLVRETLVTLYCQPTETKHE
jgi:hypothetical protein